MKQKRKHTTIICKQCGVEKSVRLDAVKGQGQRFCSQKCAGMWAKENIPKGEDHWRYKRVEVDCTNCGESMMRLPDEVEMSEYLYCNRKCQAKHSKGLRIGEKSGRWNGGTTKLRTEIRFSPKYIEWRNGVFKRDGYTCKKCNQNGGDLNAHHLESIADIIKNENLSDLKDVLQNEELFDIEYAVTLCEDCHRTFHKQYGYTGFNTEDYNNWIKELQYGLVG